jgi:hypothetical protein
MPGGDELTYFDYVKAAFRHRLRVPLLGRMPLHVMTLGLFAVLGIANPGFWLLGAATEVAYLWALSSNERFRTLVRGERLLAARADYEAQVARSLSRLSADSQQRYRRLLEQAGQIVGISQTLQDTSGDDTLASMVTLRTGGLNQLLWIFMRLLTSHELLRQNLERVDRKQLEKEVANLAAKVGAEPADSALSRSLAGTLEIQKKRLENLIKAADSLAVVSAELDRIEHQMKLIREETAVSGKAELLSGHLDLVSSTLSDTNRFLEQNAEIFGSVGLDLKSSMGSLGELPRLAEKAE